jgi:hypothetical protein
MVIFSGATTKDQDEAKKKFVLVRRVKANMFVDHLRSKMWLIKVHKKTKICWMEWMIM